MNTVKATDPLKPANMADVRWTEGNKVMAASGRSYGITDGKGKWLSSTGVLPPYWNRMGTARQVANDLKSVDDNERFVVDGIRTGWFWIEGVK